MCDSMRPIRFLAPDTDAYVDSVLRHKDEFKARTGRGIEPQIISSDEYFSNAIGRYLRADDPPDVFMSGPVLLWQHIGDGLVEPLDRYAASSDSISLDDFFESLISSNRWTGRFGDRLGTGQLWELPVNCEAYNLVYVPEILNRFGLVPPKTWAEYFRTARAVAEASGGSIKGFAQRGAQAWHTMYTGYASQFWAYGAVDFDDNGCCAIASPQGIAATTDFIEALRDAGPRDWLNQRWYELAMDVCAGEYGLIVDSDHYVAFYEAAASKMRGRVAYAETLLGLDGQRMSNMWTWSLAMNAQSTDKSAAWQFIEWAGSRSFLLRSAFEGNMNPTRRSVWDDASFIDFTKSWGRFYEVARGLIEHDAKVLVTPCPHYIELANRWVEAIREAYSGAASVQTALQKAATDINAMVSKR